MKCAMTPMACVAAAPPALAARQLHVQLGAGRLRRAVLQNIHIQLHAGRWTSIVGPNGAGKSTLLRALAGLTDFAGEVDIQGRSRTTWSRRECARTLAWLAQSGDAEVGAYELSVYDIAMLGRLPHQTWLARPSPADHAAVEQALRQTHTWHWREHTLGQLSGGERQRVLVARMLAVQADIMLMDEPLTNLDPPHQADWIALVQAMTARGRTVVSVLHEISIALRAQDMVVMQAGRVCYQGLSDTQATRAALEDVFERRLRFVRVENQWATVLE